MSETNSVRTRFAPSPTGFIHVGNIRTALFAWLIARHFNGQFILRIEDTDQKREVAGSDKHIIDSLAALGLNYDEGPEVGGSFGPYRQSQRLDIYKTWAQKLIDAGLAYSDPYSKEELDSFREQEKESKQAFLYRKHRPENPPKWDGTTALRFKSDPKSYTWHDEVMGELSSGPEVIDDFILIKSDGFPTYNFAHIIDDYEMKVSHIIRGQEFLSSMPNYLNLYDALGIKPPIFATVPHILAESGNKKLGKRDGAKDVLDYLNEGILKEALTNFIVSLGWNDGSEQEIFSIQELIEKFSLDRIGQSGARFDNKRLEWMNGQWIRRLSLDELYDRAERFWPESASGSSKEYKKQVLKINQDRLKTLQDLSTNTSYFFSQPKIDWSMLNEIKPLKNIDHQQIKILLETTKSELEKSDFKEESLKTSLNKLLDLNNQKPVVLFSLIRLSISFSPFSPALDLTLHTLGKDTVISRLDSAIASL